MKQKRLAVDTQRAASEAQTGLTLIHKADSLIERHGLRPLAANTTRELNVLRHNCHTLCVDSAKVRVLEKTDQVRLGGLLKRKHGARLETQVGLKILCNLANETLKRKLADKKVRRLLELANLTQRDGTRAVTMRLLDTPGNGRRLARGLGSQLLAGRLSTRRLPRGLLGTGHGSIAFPEGELGVRS